MPSHSPKVAQVSDAGVLNGAVVGSNLAYFCYARPRLSEQGGPELRMIGISFVTLGLCHCPQSLVP